MATNTKVRPKLSDEELDKAIAKIVERLDGEATFSQIVAAVRVGHVAAKSRIRGSLGRLKITPATPERKVPAPASAKKERGPSGSAPAAAVENYEALKTEQKAVADWKKAGEKGPKPATPLLDAGRVELEAKEAARRAAAQKSAGPSKAPATRKRGARVPAGASAA